MIFLILQQVYIELMNKTVHHTLCKLKVMSKIEPGQNLLVSESNFKVVNCKDSNWERFLKWWLGENRYKTTTKLEKFSVELRDLITNLLSDVKENESHLTRLQTELASAMHGLESLKDTYSDDKTVISQLEILQENLQIELNRLDEELINENPLDSSPDPSHNPFLY